MAGQGRKLSAAHVELFMAVLVHNENVFLHFKQLMQPQDFRSEHYQLLYRVLLDYYEENKSLPSVLELETNLKAIFEDEPYVIEDSAVDKLEEFIAYVSDSDAFKDYPLDSVKMEKYAYKVGKRLLLDTLKTNVASKLSTPVVVDNLSDFFQNYAEQAELLSKQDYSNDPNLTYAAGWDKRDPEYIYTTGFDFFDKYMSGGYKKNEIYGLMAPYGTCKTTLAVMLWCRAAEQCYAEALENPEDKQGLSFLVTYEAPLIHEIRHRALMYAAGIHRESLDNMGKAGLDYLNADPDNPLPYEKYKFAKDISHGIFKPEKQRVADVIPMLNKHTVCLDFTGADPKWPLAGSQGVNEIVSRIKLELRSRGGEDKFYVKNVIIDYLGLLVDRDVNIKMSDGDKDHKILGEHISKLKYNISTKFSCHTWILHQLSGAANAILGPTKRMHHTDAKGSKSFAENVDFSFVIGQLNLDQLGQIHCTKQRRAKRMPPSIIKVEGEFNTVYVPDNFHIDSKGQIVDKADAEAVGANSNAFAGHIEDETLSVIDSEIETQEDDGHV